MEDKDSLFEEILSAYTEAMDASRETDEMSRIYCETDKRRRNAEVKLSKLLAAATGDDRAGKTLNSAFSTLQFPSVDE